MDCKAPVFGSDQIVCCATCPHVAHKRRECSGKVFKNKHWLCEDCRLNYPTGTPASKLEEDVAKVNQAVDVIECRRNAQIDLIIARACAAALPRIEAARLAAEAGKEGGGKAGMGVKRGREEGV